jgi:hypothetical protein
METLDEQQVAAKWAELEPLINRLVERSEDPSEFPVEPGSSLAGDDRASSPYQVSHCIRMCMAAGIDHLHAVKQLIVDDGTLHLAAPFSLSRGALETFATAFWILHPSSRNERVARTLRWHAKNFQDGHKATDLLKIEGSTLEEKLAKLDAVGTPRGITPKEIRAGYASTQAIKYAETYSSVRVVFPWQLCSGFAHGRPWAYLGASTLETTDSDGSGVLGIRMTSSESTTLYPTLHAVRLLTELLRIYEQRSRVA